MMIYREVVSTIPRDGICIRCGCPVEIKYGCIEELYLLNIAQCTECKKTYSLILQAQPFGIESYPGNTVITLSSSD